LTSQGVVWLTVISSAPGKQGFVTPAEEQAYLKDQKASPTDVLLDPDGKVGHLDGAKTTPHMFLVDAKGVLVYDGAIDDKSSADPDDIAGAKNYVLAAFQETKTGKPVSVGQTAPYGCRVKYKAWGPPVPGVGLSDPAGAARGTSGPSLETSGQPGVLRGGRSNSHESRHRPRHRRQLWHRLRMRARACPR